MSATSSSTEISENFVLNDQMQRENTNNMVAVAEDSCNTLKGNKSVELIYVSQNCHHKN
jgi:hypothetical protein